MSCIITYKGQKYSEEQFKEYFINNKQEFATSIAKNKDVIDSFKRKMEEIDFVFSQSPELASIGSKAQYLQYLSTIFKTSKVKDIVYRADRDNLESFSTKYSNSKFGFHSGIFFSTDIDYLNKEFKNEKLYSALLNIKNLKETTVPLNKKTSADIFLQDDLAPTDSPYWEDLTEEEKEEEINKFKNRVKLDGIVGNDSDSIGVQIRDNIKGKEYVVSDSEQIHILSSKKDIEGFKDFVQNTKPIEKLYTVEEENEFEYTENQKQTLSKIQPLLQAGKDKKLTQDGKAYDLLGQLFTRVSNAVGNNIEYTSNDSVTNVKNALPVGNFFDTFARMFFKNPNVTLEEFRKEIFAREDYEQMKYIDIEKNYSLARTKLLNVRERIKKDLKDKNLIFITDDIFVSSVIDDKSILDENTVGIGGVLDMAVIDSKGVLHIYDFKSMFEANPEKPIDVKKIENDFFGLSKKDTWKKQQTAYALILKSTLGYIPKTNIIAVPVNYSRDVFKGNFENKGEVDSFKPEPKNVTTSITQPFIYELEFDNKNVLLNKIEQVEEVFKSPPIENYFSSENDENFISFDMFNTEEDSNVTSVEDDYQGKDAEFRKYVLSLPIVDNLHELFTFKERRVKNLETRKKQIGRQLVTTGKEEYKDLLKDITKEINKINRDLEFLKLQNSVKAGLHAMFEDLDNVESMIENNGLLSEILDTLSFYDTFLLNTRVEQTLDGIEEVHQLKSKLLSLKDKTQKYVQTQVENLLKTDQVQKVLTNLNTKNNDLNSNYYKARKLLNIDENALITEKDLLKISRDINLVDKYLLGVDDSMTGGGLQLLTRLLKDTYTATHNLNVNYVNELNVRISNLASSFSSLDFLIKKKGDKKTNYLVDMYNTIWEDTNANIVRMFNNFYFEKDYKDKIKKYKDVTENLRKNTIVLNPAKLSYFNTDEFKNNERYSEFFKYSEEEIKEYENKLKNLLGNNFDKYVKALEDKVRNFDDYWTEQESLEDNKYFSENLHRHNIWNFSNDFDNTSEDEYLPEKMSPYGFKVVFSEFKNLIYIPKDNLDKETGEFEFYDKDFQEIKQDPKKFELYNEVHKLVTFINETYSNKETKEIFLKIPWFNIETLNGLGELKDNPRKLLDEFAKNFTSTVDTENYHSLKNKFLDEGFSEREAHKMANDKLSEIKENLSGTIESRVNKKIGLYTLQDLSYKQAKEKATLEEMEKIDTSKILVNLQAASLLAAEHTARVQTKPQAELIKYYSKVSNLNTDNALRKFDAFYRQIILNKPMVEKVDTALDVKPIGNLKILNEFERTLKEDFKKLKDIGFDKPISIKRSLKGVDYDFKIAEMLDLKAKSIYLEYKIDDKTVTKEYFMDKYMEYIDAEMDNLGIPVTTYGVINGMMKLKIASSLGLNPVSGIFNRWEGVNNLFVMDNTGQYWTKGNNIKSKDFLAGVNTSEYSDNKLISKEHKIELDKFKGFLKTFVSIQDRRNELEKADSNFNLYNLTDLLYKWSQGLPEFKNQGTAVLNVLMDLKIKTSDGNEVPFFDGKKFNGLTLNSDGTVSVHEAFVPLLGEKLNSDYMLNYYNKMSSVINRVNGNYSSEDIMLLKSTLAGRATMMFKTWMPAQLMQRYAFSQDSGQLNIDMTTGKLREEGRYAKMLQKHPSLAGLHIASSISTSWGGFFAIPFTGVALPVAILLGMSGYGYYKAENKQEFLKNTLKDMLDIQTKAKFLGQVVLSTLNYSVYLGSSLSKGKSKSIIDKIGKVENKLWGENFSEEDLGNIKAMTSELAIQMFSLAWKIALYVMAKALKDEFEDEEDLLFFNFLQNQLTRNATSISDWSTNPIKLFTDSQKTGIVQDFTTIYGIMTNASRKPGRIVGDVLSLAGIPKQMVKPFSSNNEFLLPWENEKNYDTTSDALNLYGASKPFKWLNEGMKSSEEKAKKYWSDIRKEEKEKLEPDVHDVVENNEMKSDILKIMLDTKLGTKNPKKSFEETVEIYSNYGTLNTKDKFKENRDKLEEYLIENNFPKVKIEKLLEIYDSLAENN